MKSNTRYFRLLFGLQAAAGCWLLQGCSLINPPKPPPAVVPITPIAVEPVAPITEIETPAAVPELKDVAPLTTPYTVVKGDVLTTIAAQYGLRWQDVAAVNPGLNPDLLRIGQVIQLPGEIDLSVKKPLKRATPRRTLPPGEVVTYKVQKGDTLSGIAYRYGTKVAAIKTANNLTSDMIREGQTLKVPGVSKKPAVAAPTTPVMVRPAVPEAAPIEAVDSVDISAPAPELDEAAPAPAPVPAPGLTPAPVPAVGAQTYTVKEGEDLYAVAIRWGVSPSELRTLNNLTTHELRPGQTLRIPAVTPAP